MQEKDDLKKDKDMSTPQGIGSTGNVGPESGKSDLGTGRDTFGTGSEKVGSGGSRDIPVTGKTEKDKDTMGKTGRLDEEEEL